MLIRKLFVRESKITHKYYSCVHSEIPRQICSVTYSSSWNVVTMASTLRRMHNLSREPKTRGQTSRLSSQGAHMDDVENPYESKKKKKKELPIYAYPHLTLVLTRTSSPSKVGAGAGVNLFAGGAIEVLCSSQAYRHAAYRRVRRDGALGRPACVTRGMWEMSLDYSPCSILWHVWAWL
jgi:hypothetical protein